MSQQEWEQLSQQIASDDARAARKAVQRLAKTKDPAVIPYLVEAYRHSDEKVRQSARQALAAFKAGGHGGRRSPLNERTLTRILAGLAVTLVISLALNALVLAVGTDSSDNEPAAQVEQLEPSDRDEVVARVQRQAALIDGFLSELRIEADAYNTTNQLRCEARLTVPQPIALAPVDLKTFPDLAIVATRLDALLNSLEIALANLNRSCQSPEAITQGMIEVTSRLEQAEAEFADIQRLLQQSIENPAPTVGPSPTAIPTDTLTPEPGTPTDTPETPDTPAPVTATDQPTETPVPTATRTATPEPTPLPLPDLDYSELLRSLSRQFIIMGDLENNFGTGMINRWEEAQAGGVPDPRFCAFDTWPEPFTLTPDQQAELDRTDAADPQLVEAIELVQEGMNLALQARALHDRDCPAGTLANSATQGVELARQALAALQKAQTLVDTIRARSN